jgi:hypothetical protein
LDGNEFCDANGAPKESFERIRDIRVRPSLVPSISHRREKRCCPETLLPVAGPLLRSRSAGRQLPERSLLLKVLSHSHTVLISTGHRRPEFVDGEALTGLALL